MGLRGGDPGRTGRWQAWWAYTGETASADRRQWPAASGPGPAAVAAITAA
ncbi:MAG: hypothetical protein H6Q36_611, partial [Chloroflexi bacterium]|nr:hypothetical protein [Chloroflexota bacterium]